MRVGPVSDWCDVISEFTPPSLGACVGVRVCMISNVTPGCLCVWELYNTVIYKFMLCCMFTHMLLVCVCVCVCVCVSECEENTDSQVLLMEAASLVFYWRNKRQNFFILCLGHISGM